MTESSRPRTGPGRAGPLTLDRPSSRTGRIPDREAQLAGTVSVATFRDYPAAEAAVQHLADADLPIEHLAIVGNDLKVVEEVTGRASVWRSVMLGAAGGVWLGALIALLFAIFSESFREFIAILLWGLLFGALFGAVWGAFNYLFIGRERGFTSERLVLAGRYDLQVPVEHADQFRARLAESGPDSAPVDGGPPGAAYPDTAQAE